MAAYGHFHIKISNHLHKEKLVFSFKKALTYDLRYFENKGIFTYKTGCVVRTRELQQVRMTQTRLAADHWINS